MAKTLSYADAALLLGGLDNPVVTALDRVTGGLLLAAVPAFPAVLGWFDAKVEFARLGQDLVRGLVERRSGLSRYGRTQRIEAAHSVLVVTAYFEALAASDLPFRFTDLDLSRAEQESLASAAAIEATGSVATSGLASPVPLPRPYEPEEQFQERLLLYFSELSAGMMAFIRGLHIADVLSESSERRAAAVLHSLPKLAVERYAELIRRLAVDFPEVALWSASRDHAATRAEVRDLGPALSILHRLLSDISTGRVPDERRTSLANAYGATLDRPIVESTDTPRGLQIPTLAQAYVEPMFRTARVDADVRASEEQWWIQQPLREDLEEFVTGHLTSSEATVAPLLVLGQPGSGKSVLTKVLAARLPSADFLPIRVVLREVPADAVLQDQIEHAIKAVTGERLEWPALVRSAPDALPVVLLDGFDELLQATGVSQTDYLVNIARFQRREADQGRPVAVVVTSRTSVADRARPPEDTVALRLEPFDEERVGAWLTTWNSTNREHLIARGLEPLSASTVLRHPDLAGQPLLLLMLALYDADGNGLQRLAGDLGRGELYERLLRNFAAREVTKHRPSLGERDLDRAIDEELHRLAVVGLAMFNRGSQWIIETELETDLTALFGPTPTADRRDLRAPLGEAENALGRFFFIHRSQASRDGAELRTYEFLHATFGEFLVAWLVWLALHEVAARHAATAFAHSSSQADDDRLHALLSFTPLSSRAPILSFLTERADAMSAADRSGLTDLVIQLFRAAHDPRPARTHADYQPRRLALTTRHAAYSANLVLLAVCLARNLTAGELFGLTTDRVAPWHREVLLWRSQLSSEDWSGIGQILTLRRIWDGALRDIQLELAADEVEPPPVDPAWTYELPNPGDRIDVYGQHRPAVLSRKGYLQCGNLDDVALHTMAPLLDYLGATVNTFVGFGNDDYGSAAHALLQAWLLPLREATSDERQRSYLRCARLAVSRALNEDERPLYARLLVDRLATDPDVSAALVAEVLQLFMTSRALTTSEEGKATVARCGLAFLNVPQSAQTPDEKRVAETLISVLSWPSEQDPRPVAQAWVRLAELGYFADDHHVDGWPGWPDLTERLFAANQRNRRHERGGRR
ncbi:hypothetical protein [Micromonospora zamorensis]|uniref:NACHT N-terminal Helical domain-containing protein n=1 Tax=Micromonospora zamorensis TaxID=709883 RepID=A0ABZ1PPN4_9ACTN